MNYKVDFKTKTNEWKTKYNNLIDKIDESSFSGEIIVTTDAHYYIKYSDLDIKKNGLFILKADTTGTILGWIYINYSGSYNVFGVFYVKEFFGYNINSNFVIEDHYVENFDGTVKLKYGNGYYYIENENKSKRGIFKLMYSENPVGFVAIVPGTFNAIVGSAYDYFFAGHFDGNNDFILYDNKINTKLYEHQITITCIDDVHNDSYFEVSFNYISKKSTQLASFEELFEIYGGVDNYDMFKAYYVYSTYDDTEYIGISSILEPGDVSGTYDLCFKYSNGSSAFVYKILTIDGFSDIVIREIK